MNKLNFKLTQITFLIILSALLVGCSSDDPEPSLEGTRWSAFWYTEFVGGNDVYQVLSFISGTEVERFSSQENSNILGDVEILNYEMTGENSFTIHFTNGTSADGTINGNFIRFGDREYTKQ